MGETSATPKLDRLLTSVKNSIGKPQSQTGIEDPTSLATALIDLRELVGNNQLKEEVASQVSHLIVEQKRGTTDVGMLNILLSGPPGVGKTLISKNLARILISFGYLKNRVEKQKSTDGTDFTFNFNQSDALVDSSTFYMAIIISILLWTFVATVTKAIPLWGIVLGFLATTFLSYYVLKPTPTYVHQYLYKGDDKPKKGEVHQKDIIKSVTRTDFVAEYVGQSAAKTRKLLQASLGKVLFVDEAYSLINRADDPYGKECVDELCLFMSEHPGEIIVVFAGYEDLISAGVFSVNPGLRRRFKWKFSCEGYSPQELFQIFKMKVSAAKWKIENEDKIEALFRENHDAFPSFGGDVENLVDFAKMAHDDEYVAMGSEGDSSTLKHKHVLAGIARLRSNQSPEITESNNPAFKSLRPGSELDPSISELLKMLKR